MSDSLPRCPQCDARMTPSPDGQHVWCQFCGTTRDDAPALAQLAAYLERHPGGDGYRPPSRDYDMDLDQRRVLDDAWECIQEGDLPTARFLLRRALQRDDQFADAWYLLAQATQDPAERLLYLDKTLAIQPYHDYAWREKGVMEGVIPAQDAPTIEPVDGAVAAESETQACSLCGGALAFDVAAGALLCAHCGHQVGAPVAGHYHGGYDRLDNALLQRRFGFSRAWDIGERVLVCQNCHAQLTLSGTALSTQCPFCDSAHVLVEDAVGSFEEPDALLPFKLDRAAAARAVHARLAPGLRGDVVRGELLGVYLPFWAFEGLVSVVIPPTAMIAEPVLGGAFPVSDVLVGGVERPAQAVLYELMPYDLDALVPYDPRFLAQWPAQIYRVDVIQASITGRAYIKHAARLQATGHSIPPVELARTDSNGYNPPDTPLWRVARVGIEGLNYRLLLLPVWMITLVLRSGAHLPAVVNGQTGEAIISAGFAGVAAILAGPNRAPVQDLPLDAIPRRDVIRPLATASPPPRRRTVIRPLKPLPPRG